MNSGIPAAAEDSCTAEQMILPRETTILPYLCLRSLVTRALEKIGTISPLTCLVRGLYTLRDREAMTKAAGKAGARQVSRLR